MNNNSAGQVTVLIVQNPANYTVIGTAYLWNVAGAMVTSFCVNTPLRLVIRWP